MNKNIIHILPETLINKIAAGEVVERPASVIKELVENAIDAGADRITISVKNAGRDLLQVVDNGCGMTEGDAITAFERHATSKLSSREDLDKIETLGFRGEALASIAAVSMVEMKTRVANEEMGHSIKISGGNRESREAINMSPGTNIAIKNLFYNTPARRSFLKTAATENFHITRTVKRFLLSKPQISFQYINNNKVIFDCPGETLQDRVNRIIGDTLTAKFFAVDHKLGDMQLFGYSGYPDSATRDKQTQYLYLNGRYISNKNISFAIFKAYGEMINIQSYPPFVLYLKIDPRIVDVNVHPSKYEVRFANERVILNFFQQALRVSMGKESILPDLDTVHINQDERSSPRQHPFSSLSDSLMDPKEKTGGFRLSDFQKQQTTRQMTFNYTAPKYADVSDISFDEKKSYAEIKTTPKTRPIWQIHQSFIFTELKSGLIVIDQYRAHYRILYEKIIHNSRNDEIWGSQQLLFPQNFELSLEDYIIFKEIEPYLEKTGFVINSYSGHTISLEAIPVQIAKNNEAELIKGIIGIYRNELPATMEIFEKFARSFSQKNAIKKGQSLEYEEMITIVDQLFACEQPYYTPDGKSIVVTIPIEEIDKKFK